ncbi:hypothetical protein [Methylobacterium terrae]|nr:hypothetical protein [Methylobacterium terrae]
MPVRPRAPARAEEQARAGARARWALTVAVADRRGTAIRAHAGPGFVRVR